MEVGLKALERERERCNCYSEKLIVTDDQLLLANYRTFVNILDVTRIETPNKNIDSVLAGDSV